MPLSDTTPNQVKVTSTPIKDNKSVEAISQQADKFKTVETTTPSGAPIDIAVNLCNSEHSGCYVEGDDFSVDTDIHTTFHVFQQAVPKDMITTSVLESLESETFKESISDEDTDTQHESCSAGIGLTFSHAYSHCKAFVNRIISSFVHAISCFIPGCQAREPDVAPHVTPQEMIKEQAEDAEKETSREHPSDHSAASVVPEVGTESSDLVSHPTVHVSSREGHTETVLKCTHSKEQSAEYIPNEACTSSTFVRKEPTQMCPVEEQTQDNTNMMLVQACIPYSQARLDLTKVNPVEKHTYSCHVREILIDECILSMRARDETLQSIPFDKSMPSSHAQTENVLPSSCQESSSTCETDVTDDKNFDEDADRQQNLESEDVPVRRSQQILSLESSRPSPSYFWNLWNVAGQFLRFRFGLESGWRNN